jgi:hypothetical protein
MASLPTYWDMGERDRDFKWNNYLNRYRASPGPHGRAGRYQARGRASLEHTALLALGLPGKLGMSGDQVFDYWKAGRVAEIRAYYRDGRLQPTLSGCVSSSYAASSPGEHGRRAQAAGSWLCRARRAALARIRRGLGPCVKAAPHRNRRDRVAGSRGSRRRSPRRQGCFVSGAL